MRWQSPSDRVKMIVCSPVIIPAVIVMVPPCLAMAGLAWLGEQWNKRQRVKGWHSWFAWRPVYIDHFWHHDDLPSEWVWLDRVGRCMIHDSWSYRLVGEQS